MAGRHPVAAIVENSPHQNGGRVRDVRMPFQGTFGQPGLDGVERGAVEDRLMLAGMNFATVGLVADVEAVLEEIAALLETRNTLQDAYEGVAKTKRLEVLFASGTGRAAFLKVVRLARSMTVGTEIADLTVCGAVPPYNALLGGKLVAMLATSPEVVLEYKRRYQSLPSIIASSMAGRAIVRPANLVFVGTTSLYGERPNQYDRTSYPCDIVGGPKGESVRYRYLTSRERSRTSGVGTFQFGRDTKAAIEKYMSST